MKGVKFLLSCFAIIICFNNAFGTITENAICGTNVPCRNTQCIGRGRWCDGYQDCVDESDEIYCKERKWYHATNPNDCDETHHECNNGRCVPFVLMCDGYDDCGDQSDETISYCNPLEDRDIHTENQNKELSVLSSILPIPSTTLSSTLSNRVTPKTVIWPKTTAPNMNANTRTISSTKPTVSYYDSRTSEIPTSTVGYSQTQQPLVYKKEYNQPAYNIYHRKETDDQYDKRYINFLLNRRYDAVHNHHYTNHGMYCSCPGGAPNPMYEYQLPPYLRGIPRPFIVAPFPFKKVTLSFE